MKERLDSEWLFRSPIDFEYNKYVVLNYIKNSENRLNDLKLYPDLHEITMNLINITSIGKDNKIIYLTKQVNEYDEEMGLADIKYIDIPDLENKEKIEIDKTIKYSYPKFLDLFNFAKSIWTLAFDNIDIKIKKNLNVSSKEGYFYLFDKEVNILYIYYYNNNKNNLFLEVVSEPYTGKPSIIKVIQKITEIKGDLEIPIYEIITNKTFPVKETIVPIVKRKLVLKNIQKTETI
jgi:hypothetical protein